MSALGLGGYDSSGDEEVEPVTVQTQPAGDIKATNGQQSGKTDHVASHSPPNAQPNATTSASMPATIGPERPPGPGTPDESISDATALPEVDPSLSPFSRARQQMRILTMPPIPNFDIPPSPPRSPGETATDKKVKHFLALKRQGVHFNERLLSSSAMRNQGMADKLMEFAGITGTEQYENALSDGAGVDVQQWASIKVEDVVAQIAERRRQDAASRKGKPREFVSSTDKR